MHILDKFVVSVFLCIQSLW